MIENEIFKEKINNGLKIRNEEKNLKYSIN